MLNEPIKCESCGCFTDIKRYLYSKDLIELKESYYFCKTCNSRLRKKNDCPVCEKPVFNDEHSGYCSEGCYEEYMDG